MYVVVLALVGCGNVDAIDPDGHPGSEAGTQGDAPTCVTSPASLRARWRGDGNANDDTGVYTATAKGGVGFTPGRHGMAFSFDAIDDAVVADATDQLWPQGSFSVEAWVKTTVNPTSFASIIQKYDCGGADKCGASDWALYVMPGGFPAFELRVAGGPGTTITSTTTPIADNNWHHLVGVRDVQAKQSLLYVDGALAIQQPLADVYLGAMTDDGAPDPITIGASRTSGVDTLTSSYAGAIDDIAYYISVLSADDVKAIHEARDGFCM
jgi:concanavalin A-like lectin/glucanase superfamily protein